jgi:hypothetical protein
MSEFKRKHRCLGLVFRTNAVLFFKNLEEVKFYVSQRQLIGRVALNVSTNMQQRCTSYLYKRFLISREELTL